LKVLIYGTSYIVKLIAITILCCALWVKPLNATEDFFMNSFENNSELSKNPPKVFDMKEYNCLKSILWHEARNQGERGIKGVLSVVINRKNHPAYPRTYCQIENQPKQFSYVKQGRKPNIKPKPTEEKILEQISELAYNAVSGSFRPIFPSNILHYTRKEIKNSWTKQKKEYTIIQDHKFYQTKGRI